MQLADDSGEGGAFTDEIQCESVRVRECESQVKKTRYWSLKTTLTNSVILFVKELRLSPNGVR